MGKPNYSDGFQVSAKNCFTKYHTNGPGMQAFNDNRHSKLKQDSRFKAETPAHLPDLQITNQDKSKHLTSLDNPIFAPSPKIETTNRFKNNSVSSPFSKTGGHFYDIKGNTYKNTLIPKESAFVQKKRYLSPIEPDFNLNRVKPQLKERDLRSGAMLFNNIYQTNTENNSPRKADRHFESLGIRRESNSSVNNLTDSNLNVNNTFFSPSRNDQLETSQNL